MDQRHVPPDKALAKARARTTSLVLLSLLMIGALSLLSAPTAFGVSLLPGWPVLAPQNGRPASALGDIDGDGLVEVVHVTLDSRLYVYHSTGALDWAYDWYQQTGAGSGALGNPALGDIDGDGDPEIVLTSTLRSYAFHGNGQLVSNWPILGGAQATPALADLDGDGVLEVVAVWKDAAYPYTTRVIVYNGDGTTVPGWPQAIAGGVTDGGPAVDDIDGDGSPEVVLASSSSSASLNVYAWHRDGTLAAGWPRAVGGGFYCRPALGDVNGDGQLEIALASYDGNLYMLRADGSLLPDWPKAVNSGGRYLNAAPALGDLDDDGLLEVIVGSYDSKLVAWNGNGTDVPGWPVPVPGHIGGNIPVSPALGDIDGDRALEVVITTNDPDFRLYAFNNDGTLIAGWPPSVAIQSPTSAVIADIDSDGRDEVVLGGSDGVNPFTYAFGCDTPTMDLSPWPMAGGNAQRTGAYQMLVAAPEADFVASVCSGVAPQAVSFTDLSANGPVNWQWDFGDGGASTEQNPSYVYAAAGSFTVSLTVANAGGSDIETKVDYIQVAWPDTTAPVLSLPADIVAEAAGPDGAVVSFTVSASDDMDPSPLVAVTPGSGSLFPLGTTTVNCSATDSTGNSADGSFSVTVADTTTPIILAPADVAAEAAGPLTEVALGTPSVSDAADLAPVVANDAPAAFPVGTTVVTWTATDASGNIGSATQRVTIGDTAAPSLALPLAMEVEATSPAGAVVQFAVAATDAVDGSVPVQSVPRSDSVFPIGETTVVCTATDSAGNTASGQFTVRVSDTKSPVLLAPAAVSVEAAGPLTAVALGSPSVSDVADAAPAVTNDAPPAFPVGTTVVTWTATDASGNSATAQQTVTVTDSTAPTLALPADLVVEATSASGAVVAFAASAQDLVDGEVPVVSTPGSGASFALGATPVLCSATDAAGNTASGSFVVTVVDMTAPALAAPADVTAEATGLRTSVELGTPVVGDAVDLNPVVSNDAPAEGFALGTTVVTWTARDGSGNTASAAQQVTVVDTTPPVLQVPAVVSVTTADPNGAVVDLGVALASDLADPAPVITNDAPTIFPVGATTVTWTAADASGNATTGTQTVTVTMERRYANFVWLAPVSNADKRLFKRGSTIPLKFRVTDLAGKPVSNAVAQLNIRYLLSGAPDGEPVVVSTDPGDVGDHFRYSASGDLYIFNLSTRDPSYLKFWYYAADVTLDDGSVYTINFSLK